MLAVLSVAAVVCVSSAVAGELLQDFKVGYILGGTPRRIQVAELIAVVVASLVMYFPLALLNKSFGFGSRELAAPQAGLMATLAVGVVGGDMPWPLVVVGIFMGIAMIMMQVRSPMLVAVGMYLPFETTFAIFLGGVFRALGDWLAKRRGFNPAQMARVENAGVLTASGLIVGESLLGLVWAGIVAISKARNWEIPQIFSTSIVSRGTRRHGRIGRPHDQDSTFKRRRSQRTRAASRHDVSSCGDGRLARPKWRRDSRPRLSS